MKKIFLVFITTLPLISCKPTSPKDIVTDFLISLNKLDFEKTQSFVSDATKESFLQAKTEFQISQIFEKIVQKNSNLSNNEIIKYFQLDKLTETTTGNVSTVTIPTVYYRGFEGFPAPHDDIKISLEKTNNWKVTFNKQLINEIAIEPYSRQNVISAYVDLQKIYKRRNDFIANKIDNFNIQQSESLKNAMKEAESEDNSFLNIYTYIQKQNAVNNLLSNINNSSILSDAEYIGIINRINVFRNDLVAYIEDYNSKFINKIVFPK